MCFPQYSASSPIITALSCARCSQLLSNRIHPQSPASPDFYLLLIQDAQQEDQHMLQELKNLKLKLRETKGVLAIWKDKGLTLK